MRHFKQSEKKYYNKKESKLFQGNPGGMKKDNAWVWYWR